MTLLKLQSFQKSLQIQSEYFFLITSKFTSLWTVVWGRGGGGGSKGIDDWKIEKKRWNSSFCILFSAKRFALASLRLNKLHKITFSPFQIPSPTWICTLYLLKLRFFARLGKNIYFYIIFRFKKNISTKKNKYFLLSYYLKKKLSKKVEIIYPLSIYKFSNFESNGGSTLKH